MNAFTDGLHERAEREFGEFVARYPQSPMLSEATLLQAQAALKQTNAPRAIAIISAALPKSGLLQDQYRYWLGNAYLESRNYSAAADTFAAIPRAMTNSSLLLEASHGEALSRFRLGNYGAVVSLLQDPKGGFQRASQTRPTDGVTIRGKMLLAEALVRQKQYPAAQKVLEQLPPDRLLPEVQWERQYLLCRLMLAERNPVDALAGTTNLLSSATVSGNKHLLADSYLFQAGILRQLNRLDEASLTYSNNLTEAAPPDRRRLSLLNMIEIKLAQNRLDEAGSMLEGFLARHPSDAASELIALTRGEVELRSYLDSTSTNSIPADPEEGSRLQTILSRFEALITTNASPLVRGKALLNKGWCLWLDGRTNESAAIFAAAAATLPDSEDLAVARFKLADALFAQRDYTNAIAHYRSITNDFAHLPSVRNTLFDQALFQMLHASVALDDEAGATNTLEVLLQLHSESALAERSLFLIGQELMTRSKPEQSRESLLEFVRRFPQSPLRPEVELAIARTFVQTGAWDEAIGRYENWLETHSTNAIRSRAAFNRAWASYRAGRETNALSYFTNFVAEYESDTRLAPMAQYWVAEYFLRNGRYREAIGSFQKILENTNWPASRITYQARLMAGRSAFAAQLWKDAASEKGHFTALITDDNCPPDIAAQAWFAIGDTLINWDLPQTRPIEKYKEAKDAFSRIPIRYTNSPLVAAAWGKMGECYLQMASQDPKQYAEATNAFHRAMTNATADISVRTQAEFGLARTLELYGTNLPPSEAAGIQKAAFDRYYSIVIGENVRAGEYPDPFWMEKAGMEAARIAESQKQWNIAIAIYQRMQKVLEPIRPRLDERIRRVQELSRRE